MTKRFKDVYEKVLGTVTLTLSFFPLIFVMCRFKVPLWSPTVSFHDRFSEYKFAARGILEILVNNLIFKKCLRKE